VLDSRCYLNDVLILTRCSF